MQKIFLISGYLFLCSCGNTEKKVVPETPAPAQASDGHIYGIESGRMITSYMNDGISSGGKDVIYFDQWGKRYAKYVFSMAADGGGIKLSSADIRLGDTSYIINMNAKTGIKMENAYSMMTMMAGKEFPEIAQLKTFGAVKRADEVLMGKNCEVWETKLDSIISWKYIYKGIVVQTKVKIKKSEMINKGISLEENIPVSPDSLKVPAGIKFN